MKGEGGDAGSDSIWNRDIDENPGAIFESLEQAGIYVTSRVNPDSIFENREYRWLYYQDSKTGLWSFTDPYQSGPVGGVNLSTPTTVAGKRASGVIAGMGHTHGNYSDRNYNVVAKNRDYWNSDQFSTGTTGDIGYMRGGGANGKWNFFSLGTPSGSYLKWTPAGGVQPLTYP